MSFTVEDLEEFMEEFHEKYSPSLLAKHGMSALQELKEEMKTYEQEQMQRILDAFDRIHPDSQHEALSLGEITKISGVDRETSSYILEDLIEKDEITVESTVGRAKFYRRTE